MFEEFLTGEASMLVSEVYDVWMNFSVVNKLNGVNINSNISNNHDN